MILRSLLLVATPQYVMCVCSCFVLLFSPHRHTTCVSVYAVVIPQTHHVVLVLILAPLTHILFAMCVCSCVCYSHRTDTHDVFVCVLLCS